MKILVILGGVLASGDLAKAYRNIVPMLFQQGLEKKGTSFAEHEIIVALAEESIDAYFKHTPDRLVFLGTFVESGKATPAFVLAQRMLTRNIDRRKFLFTNPIHVPPFNNNENFFVITDTDGMASWFGLI